MKKVYIIHGWGGNPDEGQLKWLREQLTKKGFEVVAPLMPDTNHPVISDLVGQLEILAKDADENTYFIGHSIGCQAIIRYLEKSGKKVGGAVCIAGWLTRLTGDLSEEDTAIAKPWIEAQIDFEKVKKTTSNFAAVFSDNDPYVLFEENKKLFEEKLGAKIFVDHDKGHYTEEDGVFENPTALKAFLEIAE
jgi:predicted alpha/beta hydrolase family esterase